MQDIEKKKESGKRYYKKNKESILKRTGEYQKKNRLKYNLYSKEWDKKNPERRKEIYKKYREKHSEKIKEYKIKNKENIKEYSKDYRKENKDKIKKYSEENREIIKASQIEYHKSPKVRKRKRDYSRNKKKEDKNYRISCNLRIRTIEALNKYTKTGKIMSSEKYGIDYKAIIEHLKPFPENIELYNIHHDKPIFRFSFINKDGSTNLEEIRKAFAPENHKWMTIEEHRKLNHFEL